MISPAGGLRIYVATRPTDFRKGIDGLALVVQETMGFDPFSGAAFVFRAKRADRIKVLVWDQTGIVFGSQASRRREVRLAQGSGRCDDDVSCAVFGVVRRARLASCSSRSCAAAGTGGIAAAE